MQNLSCDFVFQHRYGKKWICYSDADMQVLNRAVKRNQKKVTLPSKDTKKQIVVNFETMLQKNVVSKMEQRVRALIYTQEFYAWMWMDTDEEYSSFRPFQIYSLEAAFQQNLSEVKFYNYGDYKVDLKNLKLIDEDCNEYKSVIRSVANFVHTPGISEIIHQNKTLLIQMSQDDSLKSLCKGSRIFDTSSVRKSMSSQKPEFMPLEVLQTSNGLENESDSKQRFSTCVDKECPNAEEYKVYSAGNLFYGATLTNTSVENNVNKYLIIQVLENNKNYFLWQRWGRIGYKAQTNLSKFGNRLNKAIETFEEKFYEKTKNEWQDILNFRHVLGKYDLLQMDLSPETIDESSDVESLLPVSVKNLLSLITSRKMMNQIMEGMSFDLERAPIGKLTIAQIKDGYSALSKIAGIISGGGKGKDLIYACDEFYTKIPHNFGRKKPPILSTLEDVVEKLKMLEALLNINIAVNILNEAPVSSEHPLDKYYRSLDCELRLINPTTNEFNVLKKCLTATHGLTHKSYELEVLDIFSCFKSVEHESYANYENKRLLWHGSRITNWIGILKGGLQIAPIEAPSTGAMFGKGLYFADASSKSANYCWATKKQNLGLLLLCEVCLGNSLDLFHEVEGMPHFIPPGYDSVTGRGKYIPSSFQFFPDVAKLPVGPLVEDKDVHSSLDYNEYVVYSTNQVKMKYLILVKFNFTS